jgi:hypothetical protein
MKDGLSFRNRAFPEESACFHGAGRTLEPGRNETADDQMVSIYGHAPGSSINTHIGQACGMQMSE